MDLIEIKLEPNWSLKVKTPNLAVNSQWHYERGGTGYDNVDGQRANNTPSLIIEISHKLRLYGAN